LKSTSAWRARRTVAVSTFPPFLVLSSSLPSSITLTLSLCAPSLLSRPPFLSSPWKSVEREAKKVEVEEKGEGEEDCRC